MQSKFYSYSFTVLVLLLSAWTIPSHANEIVEFIDIPNRIGWLPAGTDLVVQFLITLSDNMIKQYSLALERIKTARTTLRSYPPAYNSIDLFYDNDIQHPMDKDTLKSDLLKPGSGEAFKAALETIQKFSGRPIQPLDHH